MPASGASQARGRRSSPTPKRTWPSKVGARCASASVMPPAGTCTRRMRSTCVSSSRPPCRTCATAQVRMPSGERELRLASEKRSSIWKDTRTLTAALPKARTRPTKGPLRGMRAVASTCVGPCGALVGPWLACANRWSKTCTSRGKTRCGACRPISTSRWPWPGTLNSAGGVPSGRVGPCKAWPTSAAQSGCRRWYWRAERCALST